MADIKKFLDQGGVSTLWSKVAEKIAAEAARADAAEKAAAAAAKAAQDEIDALEAYVGVIPEGYTESNIVAYINKKAQETLDSASGDKSSGCQLLFFFASVLYVPKVAFVPTATLNLNISASIFNTKSCVNTLPSYGWIQLRKLAIRSGFLSVVSNAIGFLLITAILSPPKLSLNPKSLYFHYL